MRRVQLQCKDTKQERYSLTNQSREDRYDIYYCMYVIGNDRATAECSARNHNDTHTRRGEKHDYQDFIIGEDPL